MSLPEASANTSGAGALAGIRILDFGQMVSAPCCAKLFSDYGADVIKMWLIRRRAGSISSTTPTSAV